MAIDLAQFHQVFFEESFEGLDVMESGLLAIDCNEPVDLEDINTIFRAAHSIKGGSGTFGFHRVSEFTHGLETLLDQMRSGQRQPDQRVVDCLLGSVDCLRTMLEAMQQGDNANDADVARYQAAIDAILDQQNAPVSSAEEPAAHLPPAEAVNSAVESPSSGWRIAFSPRAQLLQRGNDPVRIFRELDELGELEVAPDFIGLPEFGEFDPEICYLSWRLELAGTVDRSALEDVFAWVEDDCDFAIQPLGAAQSCTDVSPQVSPEPSAESEAVAPATDAPPAKDTSDVDVAKVKTVKAKADKPKSAATIRVDTQKIDHLINMVGELVITQSMLGMLGENFTLDKLDALQNGLAQLERHTRELQESVMSVRMMPISFVFGRFPRLVHDLSAQLGKKIELKLIGEQTEVDKTVVELIADPLVHLVRNSLDHGIETSVERVNAGKSETGQLILEAYQRSGQIIIEVKDDGRGLNADKLRAKAIEKNLIDPQQQLTQQQIYELIFAPGFSTAEALTDISGRGVGMDVVRRNIQSLGGSIHIDSEQGQGTRIAIHLPLTLAILDGQSVAVGHETYIIPLNAIIESINVDDSKLNRVAGVGETFKLREEYLPIVRLQRVFAISGAKASKLSEGLVVVVEGPEGRCGLFVDDLLGQQQVVIKSLDANYRPVEGISGATILGDGSVALILDIPGLLRLSVREQYG
ncbi:MAG: chemotaxis protein CheA [Methylococcales bacterium]|nr:chemotaxis protein CheA [Methylococcales bacterium]